ncbi:MAG: aminotransferase class I/II-fold pyridoxal phosphate-dependent enzyme [Vicingaceae bacterium]|nr:MAG: aminotransferase class I/II-fold pyridoxal phosphate-dependent enzyme [Vicingaceae bacterium]
MALDLFDKIEKKRGPLGQYAKIAHGYFTFPKLEGEIGSHMYFRGKKVLQWSLNNYLGLANEPEIRKVDAEAAKEWGLAYPMGARMMTGNTNYHEQLEAELAEFEQKQDAILFNYGYMGIMSTIDALVDRKDVIVYDAESHACIIDGVRLHQGKRFVYLHNNMESLEKQLIHATKVADETGGCILVITEGVFGMSGNQGNLKGIVELKKKYTFRLLVDDAHGFGIMGPNGRGTGEHQGVQDGVDIYCATFAKSMALIGGLVASTENICQYLRYNVRSQIYAKALPMPIVIGALKRLDMIRTRTDLREKTWTIVNALQKGLREHGFNIGKTNSPVTPVVLNGDVSEGKNLALELREGYNIFCSVVIYPVVPKGTIILRLIPTAMHSLEDVNYTVNSFAKIKDKLDRGEFKTDEVLTW